MDKTRLFRNRNVDTWDTCDKCHAILLPLYRGPYFIPAASAILTGVVSSLHWSANILHIALSPYILSLVLLSSLYNDFGETPFLSLLRWEKFIQNDFILISFISRSMKTSVKKKKKSKRTKEIILFVSSHFFLLLFTLLVQLFPV